MDRCPELLAAVIAGALTLTGIGGSAIRAFGREKLRRGALAVATVSMVLSAQTALVLFVKGPSETWPSTGQRFDQDVTATYGRISRTAIFGGVLVPGALLIVAVRRRDRRLAGERGGASAGHINATP